MADKKPFSSIIDTFLADREPEWSDLGLADAKKSGEEVQDRTHDFIDKDFMDEIAESASKHTPIPAAKNGTFQSRMSEKEKASPQVASVQADWRKSAVRSEDYRNANGDNDALLDEVTHSLEQAGKDNDLAENSAEKKSISDNEIKKYIRDLLNSGTAPSKVATKLQKLAEIELFNKTMATDYLQRNAGMMGLAYLEPNTFMDKENPNYNYNDKKLAASENKTFDTSTEKGLEEAEKYKAKLENKYDKVTTTPAGLNRVRIQGQSKERTASNSNDCIRQQAEWKRQGIQHQAKSVKQITACTDCTFFKKDASGKRCNLYHLPVVANVVELTQIVNNLTPGVPMKKKRAALVQIANRIDEHAQPFDAAKTAQSNITKVPDTHISKQAKRIAPKTNHFSSEHLAKLHEKGVSLKAAYVWAEEKFGSVEVSTAFRGFVQSLRKNEKGRVVVASADLKFLNTLGIRSESFEGSAKCASCPSHYAHQTRGIESDRGAQRVEGKFAQRTASVVATQQEETKSVTITAKDVRAMHQKGHSLERIFSITAKALGTVEAKKVVAAYLGSLKKMPGRITVSASDKGYLVKQGFKKEAFHTLEGVRRPTDQVVATSGSAPVLSYPGAGKQASANVEHDGMSLVKEFDLNGPVESQDIDVSGPDRLDVEEKSTFSLD